MSDLLGPADAPFVTTTRPADTRVFPAVDTYFKDCSAPGAGDGTRIGAALLNGLLQQIRRAIRGQGVTEDNTDDDMLLKAIQAIANVSVSSSVARNYNPVYPHVLASNGLLGVTGSTGQAVVSSGNIFLHRGLFPVNTADYSTPNRTFATAANKSYHLRWRWSAGAPVFALFDVADPTYNPSALAESNPAFDTVYDDMLVARVVTDGSNNPTITMLANKARLDARSTYSQGNLLRVYDWTALTAADLTLNWARTPIFAEPIATSVASVEFKPDGAAVDTGAGAMAMFGFRRAAATSRYAAKCEFVYDDNKHNYCSINLTWIAHA